MFQKVFFNGPIKLFRQGKVSLWGCIQLIRTSVLSGTITSTGVIILFFVSTTLWPWVVMSWNKMRGWKGGWEITSEIETIGTFFFFFYLIPSLHWLNMQPHHLKNFKYRNELLVYAAFLRLYHWNAIERRISDYWLVTCIHGFFRTKVTTVYVHIMSVFLLNQKSAANLFSFVRKALLFWRKSNINYAYLVSLTEIKVMEKIYSLIPLNRATWHKMYVMSDLNTGRMVRNRLGSELI